MRKKITSIPVNLMADKFGTDIFIARAWAEEMDTLDEEVTQSHRDNCHLFFTQETGTVIVEVDFRIYETTPCSVMYIHPNQVHRLKKIKNVTGSLIALNNENLNPEYLQLLEEISPVKPLTLSKETFAIIAETTLLCAKLSERREEKLYHSLLKDSCNALVALIISQYLVQSNPTGKLSRFEEVTKAFKTLLETNFTTIKRPADYAQKLNISTSYLNECVKNTTGYSVSYYIQQRIILEAKRLLYHSRKSVKEIATELGYDDYPYFSRLFTKVVGMSALTFRDKNHD